MTRTYAPTETTQGRLDDSEHAESGAQTTQVEPARIQCVKTPPRDLTALQVAERLQVHPRTVTEWINRGELDAINVGGTRTHGARWRVSEKALETFRRNREHRP